MSSQWIEIVIVVGAYLAGRIEQYVCDVKASADRKK